MLFSQPRRDECVLAAHKQTEIINDLDNVRCARDKGHLQYRPSCSSCLPKTVQSLDCQPGSPSTLVAFSLVRSHQGVHNESMNKVMVISMSDALRVI